ncbi:MAG: hypothetical protein R2861_11290 [Desulfobacterales bacterium]
MKTIRPASFAGSWYPASATACEKEIQAFLKETGFPEIPAANYIGGIVPCGMVFFREPGLPGDSCPARTTQPAGTGGHAVFGMHMHPSSAPVIMPAGAWKPRSGK